MATVLLLTGCSMQLSFDDSDSDNIDNENVQSETESRSARSANVTIIQYANYNELNECCEGVKSALDDANIGYTVVVGGDSDPRGDCEQAAQDIAINSSCDLVVAIGTPCAEAVCAITNTAGKIPVVFCAVTDPVGAKLVNNIKEPGGNCTGVACAFNINEQLNMINTFQPYITRLGVIYSSSEQNAQAQLGGLKKAAEKLGISVTESAVDDSTKLSAAAKELLPKVEAVVVLPDHLTAKSSWGITDRSIVEEIPAYGVTATQIKEGFLAGYCFDFKKIGEEAGKQAADVLHGESIAEMPVIMESDCTLYVNEDRLEDLDMKIPDEYKDKAVKIKTSYNKP